MNDRDFVGKSVFITGANGGLGKETVKWLIADGFTRIVMASRSADKVTRAKEDVLAVAGASGDVSVEAVGGFDMTDPTKIEAAVGALAADAPFDVVFLQAGGVVFGNDYQTVQWNGRTIERTIFQNVIGGHLTLLHLMKRGLVAPGARVVIAGGEGARGIPGLIDRPEFESPAELRRYVYADTAGERHYNPMNAIGVSKFMGALWSTKLAELAQGELTVLWFSPGLTYGTDGLAGKPPIQRWFLENIAFGLMRLLGKAQSPADGARKYADCLEGKVGGHGDVIGAPEGTALGELVDQTPMNPGLADPALREEFWRLVEDVGGPFTRTQQGIA